MVADILQHLDLGGIKGTVAVEGDVDRDHSAGVVDPPVIEILFQFTSMVFRLDSDIGREFPGAEADG
jgi:hypothetical protein